MGGQPLHHVGERVGNAKRRGFHGLVKDLMGVVGFGLRQHPLDCCRCPLGVRTSAKGAEGARKLREHHPCHHPRQTVLGDNPVLRTLPPRGGVVGRRESLDVAQLPDPRLED